MDIAAAAPAVWKHAVEVFGSEAKAASWFKTPLWELQERTPEETVSSEPDLVDAVLGRIEYGVFS